MRSPNDKDKRTCKLYPTERALSVIDEIQTVCEKTEALLLQGFRESDKNLFIDLLIQAGENITAELRMERKGMNLMTENPLGYEKISKLLKDFAIPSIMASLVGSIYNIVDQILLVKGSVIWEMQQPMLLPSLPSALLLHCWLELAVLPVFPSVLDAKSRKLPPKQREMVLF